MKCHLVNVVDNYYYLISDAQYYGLCVYKRRFGNDPSVSLLFKSWFKHSTTVTMTPNQFLSLSGLTYFGDIKHKRHGLRHHITTASKMATTSATTSADDVVKSVVDDMVTDVDNNAVVASVLDDMVSKIEQMDMSSDQQVSRQEAIERVMITGDDGSGIARLQVMMTGMFTMVKLGWETDFSIDTIREYFNSPWAQHPFDYKLIKSIYDQVNIHYETIGAHIAVAPKNSILSQLKPSDIFRMLESRQGDPMLSIGIKQSDIPDFNPIQFIRDIFGEDDFHKVMFFPRHMQRFQLDKGSSAQQMSQRIAQTYFKSSPSSILDHFYFMIYKMVPLSFIKDVIDPGLLNEVVDLKTDDQSIPVSQLLLSRINLGDKKAEFISQKIRASFLGSIIGTMGIASQVFQLSNNIGTIASEIQKYYKGDPSSNVKKSFVELLVNSEDMYNSLHTAMISAVETIGVQTAIDSGLDINQFVGGASQTMSSMILRQIVVNNLRNYVGMKETVQLRFAKKLAKAPAIIAASVKKITSKRPVIMDIARSFSKRLKRKREDDSEPQGRNEVLRLRDIDTSTFIYI